MNNEPQLLLITQYSEKTLEELEKKYGDRIKVNGAPDYRYYERFKAVMGVLGCENHNYPRLYYNKTSNKIESPYNEPDKLPLNYWIVDDRKNIKDIDCFETQLYFKKNIWTNKGEKELRISLEKSHIRGGYGITMHDGKNILVNNHHDADMSEILGIISLHETSIKENKPPEQVSSQGKNNESNKISKKVAELLEEYPELAKSLPNEGKDFTNFTANPALLSVLSP